MLPLKSQDCQIDYVGKFINQTFDLPPTHRAFHTILRLRISVIERSFEAKILSSIKYSIFIAEITSKNQTGVDIDNCECISSSFEASKGKSFDVIFECLLIQNYF